MNRWKLSTQISIMFTAVTVIISLVFLLIFEFSLQRVYQNENKYQLNQYLNDVVEWWNREAIRHNNFNGYIIYEWELNADDEIVLVEALRSSVEETIDLVNNEKLMDHITQIAHNNPPSQFQEEIKIERVKYHIDGKGQRIAEEGGFYVIVFTDNRYTKSIRDDFAQTLRFTVLVLIALGNVSLLLWSRLVLGRIGELQGEISLLVKSNYERPIKTEGKDEIAGLAQSVEQMRLEILENEQTKREIMQNISHDFKTPISVIRTYGEAIKDGVTDVNDIDVIIGQAELLNHKVVQLLQLNKITYLTQDQEPEAVFVKTVIHNIVNKNKFKFDKEFVLNLDNSTYIATAEGLEIAIGNVIDNAMRYAETKIVIVLKNKILTIYNDGEYIDEAFMEKIFKPYEKSNKGEFGLGMSITQQTLAFYNLTISVKNVRKGVMFVIEPIG